MPLPLFRIYKRLGLILLVAMLQTCVSEECDTKSDPVLRLAFVRLVNEKEAAFPVGIRKITGKADSQEVTLTDEKFDTTKAISGIRLPLSQTKDRVQFILHRTGNLGNASFTVSYQRKPYFISQACGFEIEYNNISAVADTTGRVDTVQVMQPSINANINEVNIKILFKQ